MTGMCQGCVGNLFGSLTGLRATRTRREFIAESIAAAGSMMALGAGPALGETVSADTIFKGGSIVPIGGGDKYAGALAIAGGKIVAVGDEADVMNLSSASTRIVDLDGRTMLPGFIDPHQHTTTGALITALFEYAGYTKYPRRDDVIAAMKAKAAATPADGWMYFTSFDNLLQGGDLTLAELDAVSATQPIMVYYINMHTASVNTAALKAAKIPDDIGALPGGGRFGRDANGKLDGMVYEQAALMKFLIGLPKITPELAGKATLDWLQHHAAVGNTTVHEAGVLVFGDLLQGYERVAAQSPCRASISLMYDSMKDGEPYKKYGYGAKAAQVPGSLLSLYAIKIVGDGSNQTESGAQTVPYLGGGKGQLNFDPAELKSMVQAVKDSGWPISIHANGDAAVDNALDAIEAAYGANPPTGVNRIEHCTITRPEQIARMVRLGIQPSFLMNHVYFYGAAYRDQLFGPDRANRMDPAGDCVRAGLPFTLHTDAPCSNIGALQLIQCAVTRRCSIDGSIVGEDQAVSLTEALKAVTIHAAGQIGMADRIGTLEIGKEADMTILEGDPYKVDPDAIMNIKISETWVAGRQMSG